MQLVVNGIEGGNATVLLCERGDLAAAEPSMRDALDIRHEALG